MGKLFIDGQEITPPMGVEPILSTSEDKRRKCTFKPINLRTTLLPGEMAISTDGHTLIFCFYDNQLKSLNFDENVTEETARELIESIKLFYEERFGR